MLKIKKIMLISTIGLIVSEGGFAANANPIPYAKTNLGHVISCIFTPKSTCAHFQPFNIWGATYRYNAFTNQFTENYQGAPSVVLQFNDNVAALSICVSYPNLQKRSVAYCENSLNDYLSAVKKFHYVHNRLITENIVITYNLPSVEHLKGKIGGVVFSPTH